jgi:hypothetical protein
MPIIRAVSGIVEAHTALPVSPRPPAPRSASLPATGTPDPGIETGPPCTGLNDLARHMVAV